MKKTIQITGKAAGIVIILLAITFIVSSMRVGTVSTEKRGRHNSPEVQASIPVTKLKKAALLAGGQRLPLYLYIVKANADTTDKGLHLIWCTRDQKGKSVFEDRSWNEAVVKREMTSYVHFLRTKNIGRENVIVGYQVELDPQVLEKTAGLEIHIFPFERQKNTVLLIRKGKHQRPGSLLLSTDTCKIPPGCPGFDSNISASVNSIMAKEYGQ